MTDEKELQLKDILRFSQATISPYFSQAYGKPLISVDDEWKNEAPFTLPIDIVEVADETFISIDNRRLYSARKYGPSTFDITIGSRKHNFDDLLPQERLNINALKQTFAWNGVHDDQIGVYELVLQPKTWGMTALFRTSTQDPSFPTCGRVTPLPTIGGAECFPYYIFGITGSPIGIEYTLAKEMLIEAWKEGDALISFNGDMFVKRESLKDYVDIMFNHCYVMSFNFRPGQPLILRAEGEHKEQYINEDRELYSNLSQSLSDFEDKWERIDMLLSKQPNDLLSMCVPPQLFKASPAVLHRISKEVNYYPRNATDSKNQMTKYVKMCDVVNKPDISLVKDSVNDYVSKFGNLFINVECKAHGISTFVPSDNTENAFKAAHDLFTKDGTPLDCFVLPQGIEVENIGFLYDRDIRTCNPVAHHVTIYPVNDTTPFECFKAISICKYPEDTWQMCRYRGGAENYEEPDLPLDPVFECVLIGLEQIATNTNLSDDMRVFARLYQYTICDKEWTTFIRGDYDPHLFLFVLAALVNYRHSLESGHVLGTVNGAVCDLVDWFNKQGEIVTV